MPYALFDARQDRVNLLPLSYLKPIAALRIGILTILEKWERVLGEDISIITEDYLQNKYPTPAGGGILINSCLLPSEAVVSVIQSLKPGQKLRNGDTLLAANVNSYAQDTTDLEAIDFAGEPDMAQRPWDFFRKNGQQIKADFQLLTSGRQSQPLNDPHTATYGSDIFLEEGARVKAAILNAEEGPIYLGKGSTIHEGAIIRGPFALGEGAHINMGAKIRGDATVGPYSKVGGEYSNTIIMGYSNKAHDGFLGNAVIGEWCNIGAASDSSNLKNNYRNVQVWSHATDRYEDTGMQFCGLIMGDHSKCSIHTTFNTGTVVGVSASLFGEGFHKKFVPSFAWGGRDRYATYQLEKAYEMIELVMARRGKKLEQQDKDIIRVVYERSAKYRTWEN